MNPFTYKVMREEWYADVGHIDCYGNPQSFRPYWTSQPFPTQNEALAAMKAHDDVLGYDQHLMRHVMAKSYTDCRVRRENKTVRVFEDGYTLETS